MSEEKTPEQVEDKTPKQVEDKTPEQELADIEAWLAKAPSMESFEESFDRAIREGRIEAPLQAHVVQARKATKQ